MNDCVKIVIPGDDPPQIAGSAELERLSRWGNVEVYSERPASDAEKLERVRDADVILNSRSAVTWRDAEMRALPRLRMLATCSVGTDAIDLDSARELGIVVSNQPGANAPFVAEHMFGLMFAVAKQAAVQTAALKAGRWLLPVNAMLQGEMPRYHRHRSNRRRNGSPWSCHWHGGHRLDVQPNRATGRKPGGALRAPREATRDGRCGQPACASPVMKPGD